MKLRYRILYGQQVLAEGVGQEIPTLKTHRKKDADLVIRAEQAFERVTGLRLHLFEEVETEEPSTIEDVSRSTDDLVPGIASTSLLNELHPSDLPVVLIQTPLANESSESPARFDGGDSGGGGASASYGSDSSSDSGSSSSSDSGGGSSGSND